MHLSLPRASQLHLPSACLCPVLNPHTTLPPPRPQASLVVSSFSTLLRSFEAADEGLRRELRARRALPAHPAILLPTGYLSSNGLHFLEFPFCAQACDPSPRDILATQPPYHVPASPCDLLRHVVP